MVDMQTKSDLLDLVMEGYLSVERNEDGEMTFKLTNEGKQAIEQWILMEGQNDAG